MPPKKDTKTKIDDEKYFPAVKVDVTKPLNKGSMSWTDESTTFLISQLIENKRRSHTSDNGCFTKIGWYMIANKFNREYNIWLSNNWNNKFLVEKLKTKVQDLVLLQLIWSSLN